MTTLACSVPSVCDSGHFNFVSGIDQSTIMSACAMATQQAGTLAQTQCHLASMSELAICACHPRELDTTLVTPFEALSSDVCSCHEPWIANTAFLPAVKQRVYRVNTGLTVPITTPLAASQTDCLDRHYTPLPITFPAHSSPLAEHVARRTSSSTSFHPHASCAVGPNACPPPTSPSMMKQTHSAAPCKDSLPEQHYPSMRTESITCLSAFANGNETSTSQFRQPYPTATI
ncbi:hypothetical protein PENSPDRAFT_236312 [Peniophora sp. CONT]|nr:hypothetical protein PENSPDRAFT_236312 [Peniophora sp. CONT]